MTRLEDHLHHIRSACGSGPLPSPQQIASLVRAADPLWSGAQVAEMVGQIRAHLGGFGPLDPLLHEPDVSDILVNGPGPVWIERAGQLERTDLVLDRAQIDLLVERIVAPLGRRADPVHTLVDGRMPDGSRVHVVVPPIAVDGPCVTIRRFSVQQIPLDAFASPAVARLLQDAMADRKNIVVSGATGSGKTTLLNTLAAEIDETERVVTVEDAAELRLGAPHVVRLEARVGDPGGAPAVTIRDLVRSALRMRPDRLVVGEVRGSEAFDLVAAMSTGHRGSLATVHANSAADALDRLETLVLLADVGLPHLAVRRQLSAAIDLLVHVARAERGRRVVVEVAQVLRDGSGIRVLVAEGKVVSPDA